MKTALEGFPMGMRRGLGTLQRQWNVLLRQGLIVAIGLMTAAPSMAGQDLVSCQAARGDRQARVIEGSAAAHAVTGWQVSLRFRGQHACGGSLLAGDIVLTAAHCLYGEEGRIRYSEADFTVGHGGVHVESLQGVRVRRIFEHRDYQPLNWTAGHDIAILQLETPFGFNGADTPQLMPRLADPSTDPKPGTCMIVTGWGDTDADPNRYSGSDVLQMAAVPRVDRSACETALGQTAADIKDKVYRGLAADQFCAGYEAGGRDSCGGDSGGPLTYDLGPFRAQAGIVSWGFGCGRAKAFGVYTSVAHHRRWIDAVQACIKTGTGCAELAVRR